MAFEADCGMSTVLGKICVTRTAGFLVPGEWVATPISEIPRAVKRCALTFARPKCIFFVDTEVVMRSRVQKWGNSLAVRIPKAFATDLGLVLESEVDLTIEDGRFVLRPLVVPRFELNALLEQVREENIHDEVDFGNAAGSEVW